jgi:hypothetical protein
MSEYPIVTNKYAAKAQFSGNICNDICKFVYVASANTLAEVSSEKGVVEFESPLTITAAFGSSISVKGSAAGKVNIEGYDYLGQKIVVSEQTVTTTASVLAMPFKYITKVEAVSDGDVAVTVTVVEDMTKAFPEFKVTKLLAAKKNGADMTVPTLTAPVVTENTNGQKATRGVITLSGAVAGDVYEFIGIADNSLVTINDEEVGGLYGNPSVISE